MLNNLFIIFQEEYAQRAAADGETDWHFFLRHTWLPVLAVAYEGDWRPKFGSDEMAAMLALHQTLVQPKAPVTRPAGVGAQPLSHGTSPARNLNLNSPGNGTTAATAAGGVAGGGGGVAQPPLPPPQAPPSPSSAHSDGNDGYEGYSTRSFTVDAVDVDGKRRRLRRKRAASPEEHADALGGTPSSPPPTSPALNKVGGAAGISQGGALQQHAKGGKVGGAVMNGSGDGSGGMDIAASSALVTRLLQNMAQLSLSKTGAERSFKQQSGGTGEERSTIQTSDAQAGSLSESLAMIHDLSQRLISGLRLSDVMAMKEATERASEAAAAVAAGDESLPAPSSSSTEEIDTFTARDVLRTLRTLLGANLADRTDLLGRTALHVAVANGQHEAVAALVAAGCDVNKRLPMDPRILQRYALGKEEDVPPEDSTSTVAGAGVEALPSASDLEPPSWPSKQGKYSTGVRPPQPSPSSMQGSTALHWAASLGDTASIESLLNSCAVDVNARTIEGATALHWAARGGHSAAAGVLCRAAGIDLDATDSQGRTPLHVASALGHSGVVQHLWARGACIDPPDCYDWRPLHYATRESHAAVASHLVIAGSQVQAFDPDGVTAGHLAAERGHVDILDRLLIAGYLPDAVAGPYSADGSGTTALHLAAAQGHAQAVDVLLRWSASPQAVDALGCTPLDCAVMAGHFALTPVLLAAGCGMRCPLGAAGETRNAPGILLLTQSDATEKETPLKSAAATVAATGAKDQDQQQQSTADNSSSDTAAAIVPLNQEAQQQQAGSSNGVEESPQSMRPPAPPPPRMNELLHCLAAEDPTKDPTFATVSPSEPVFRDLFDVEVSFAACAAAVGKPEVLKALKMLHDNQTVGDITTPMAPDMDQALLLAVRGGRSATVQWLVQHGGCSPETSPRHSLLHHAAALGHRDVLDILIGAGWDPTRQHCGMTPLQEAVACGHESIAESLLATPGGVATVDNADHKGYTALHYAAGAGMTGLVGRLLNAGASPDVQLSDGRTPAHLAAKEGYVSALQTLITSGASLGAVDGHNWTALHFIAQRGDLASFVLLHGRTAPLLTPRSAAALLTAAVRGGSPEMVGSLLMSGTATPKICTDTGETPVHAAAREGFLEALTFFAEAGFNLSATDEEGRTPLHHVPTGYGHASGGAARHEDFVAASELLLAAGCRANAPDAHFCTPVHIAAGCGSSDMLRRFMELAPDAINAGDEIGWTPLFWAANEGHGEIFHFHFYLFFITFVLANNMGMRLFFIRLAVLLLSSALVKLLIS